MRCQNCEDKWRLVLAQQFNTNNMKDKNKQSDLEVADNGDLQSGPNPETNLQVKLQAAVPPLLKPDVNKVIEERRKALQGGKVINK